MQRARAPLLLSETRSYARWEVGKIHKPQQFDKELKPEFVQKAVMKKINSCQKAVEAFFCRSRGVSQSQSRGSAVAWRFATMKLRSTIYRCTLYELHCDECGLHAKTCEWNGSSGGRTVTCPDCLSDEVDTSERTTVWRGNRRKIVIRIGKVPVPLTHTAVADSIDE